MYGERRTGLVRSSRMIWALAAFSAVRTTTYEVVPIGAPTKKKSSLPARAPRSGTAEMPCGDGYVPSSLTRP